MHIQKEVKSIENSPAVKKSVWSPTEGHGGKRYKIQGGGLEMAVI